MKIVFEQYGPDETITVSKYLKNRKLRKYFNRETAAAIVSLSKLLDGEALPHDTPFFYATGLFEYEEYGLPHVVADSMDSQDKFSDRLFIDKGISRISPLTSFKVLQNMTLAFVSIEHQLTGDNAVVYISAASLLQYALHAAPPEPILIGAGQVHQTGRTESGFALVSKEDIVESSFLHSDAKAIDLFRTWSGEKVES